MFEARDSAPSTFPPTQKDKKMRIIVTRDCVILKASEHDTLTWATRPGDAWPCSTLSGLGFTAEYDSNGLLDFNLSKPGADTSCIDGQELSAICCDLLKDEIDKSHPAYEVIVG